MNPITITVKRIGQTDINVTVEAGTTVSDVLRITEIDAAGWTFKFNGYNVSGGDRLDRTGALLLTKAIRGN